MVDCEKAPQTRSEAASSLAVRYFMTFDFLYKLKIKIIHANKYSFKL
jgi:hypothetical protein